MTMQGQGTVQLVSMEGHQQHHLPTQGGLPLVSALEKHSLILSAICWREMGVLHSVFPV